MTPLPPRAGDRMPWPAAQRRQAARRRQVELAQVAHHRAYHMAGRVRVRGCVCPKDICR